MSDTSPAPAPPPRTSLARRVAAGILLVAPFVVYLSVPTYAKDGPRVAGFPFFYWWQLLWVVLTAVCIGSAHLLTRKRGAAK
ncbi:DUF3311 domain-containing protein [Actinomadura opuntiae]|uniref:DUF3311 domain-containing protein n=1 Tax=Actinomadura sp. OS1-43 TaxID=604315 RepID=UPI00255AF485|nr:DUF3311 domain-containing protein [Actinomadura sp. OS1-43]MDL4813894.1 DUF3311 domain-containing protein [Actinomadura sp. OS1-43]